IHSMSLMVEWPPHFSRRKEMSMRKIICAGALLIVVALLSRLSTAADAKPEPEWSMNATIIEACSCPMFCQCYFDTKPAAHAGHGGHNHGGGAMSGEPAEHYCKFNNAFKVNSGNYGDVRLDGAKFWIAGDLGGDFSKGQMDWACLTFDTAVTPQQREAIAKIAA